MLKISKTSLRKHHHQQGRPNTRRLAVEPLEDSADAGGDDRHRRHGPRAGQPVG